MAKILFDKKMPYWGIFFLYCIFSILTIENYQLPWGDEIFFVDMAQNYLMTGKLINFAYFPESPVEIKSYGPVFFWLNSKLFAIFGYHIWIGRILNLLSGLIVIGISLKILERIELKKRYIFLFLLLMVSDPNFNFILHSGRMDLVAVLFFMVAVYIFMFLLIENRYKYLLCGALIALGALTTSRLFLLLPLLIFYPLFGKTNSEKKKIFISLFFVFIGMNILYSIWILYEFKNINNFINYFINDKTLGYNESNVFNTFMLSGNWFNKLFRNSYLFMPRYILFYGAVIYLFMKKNIGNREKLIFFTLVSLSFILLVREMASEAYIAMVKPLIYIIIVCISYEIFKEDKMPKIYKYGTIFLLFVVFSIHFVSMSHKILKIYVTGNELNNAGIEQIIKTAIPNGSLVMADPRYFYECKAINCKFMAEEKSFNKITPEYIITKNKQFDNEKYELISDFNYQKWKPKSNIDILQKLLDYTSKRNNYSSNAYIYKLISINQFQNKHDLIIKA